MAEGSEKSLPQNITVSTTKHGTGNSQNNRSTDSEVESVLQEIVEIDYQPDCPVCLQAAFHPVKLPCGHIFCFLCIKGVALRSRKCAICRQGISAEYLDKPILVKVSEKTQALASTSDVKETPDQEENDYKWYYEGRNGWWQYDDKTSKEVEICFKSGKRSCTLLIAGFLYFIDFENMFQMRRNEPGRRRRIKRDKSDVESKGIAGIRKPQNIAKPSTVSPETNHSTDMPNQINNADLQPSPDVTQVTSGSQGGESSSSLDSVMKDDVISERFETTSLE